MPDSDDDTRVNLSAWIVQHQDSSLIRAIESSNYFLFQQLLAAGQDINSNDYLLSRDGSLPILPIHAAAANPNPLFLQTLIELGADPDDECQYNNPTFNNSFRTAVRAGQWDNIDTIIKAGGVHGEVNCDYIWEERNRLLDQFDDFPVEDNIKEFASSLFRLPWHDLANVTLPEVELLHRRCPGFIYPFDSLGTIIEQFEEPEELCNLEWMITEPLPHLKDSARRDIITSLIRGGAHVSCYTSPSYVEMWDTRALVLTHSSTTTTHYDQSPIESLGFTFHRSVTPLHTCVLTSNELLLRYLVSEAKFNVDLPEFTTRAATPLFLAIAHNNIESCRILVGLGARIDYLTPMMHLSAVHFAASTRSLPLLEWVAAEIRKTQVDTPGDAIFSQRSLLNHTALHIACLPSCRFKGKGALAQSIHYTLPPVYSPPSRPRRVRAWVSLGFDSPPTSRQSLPSRAFLELLQQLGAGTWTDVDHHGNSPAHYLCAALNGMETNEPDVVEARIILNDILPVVKDIRNEFGFSVEDLIQYQNI